MQAPERRSTPALLFDSSIEDDIGQILALVMLLGYESKREVRLTSLSVSRNNLKVAAFCDVMARFFGVSPSIGMSEAGAARTNVSPALQAVLTKQATDGKPAYARTINKMNDTADPVALMRNALTAQQDQNSTMILAGPPINLLGLLALPGTTTLIEKKVRSLIVAAPSAETEAVTKLIAQWPSPVVLVEESVGNAVPFPAESIETDFAWAPNHPLVDAYRAAKTMPYDASTNVMAAVLYAAHPEGKDFTVTGSEKVRRLAANTANKEQTIQTYRQAVSIHPPERRGGRGPQQ